MATAVMRHFAAWCLGLSGPETQTTPDERRCLARHAAGRCHLVEIGVWHGVGTSLLRTAMVPDGILLAVDPFPPGRLGFSPARIVARREVSRVCTGTVRWMRTTGERAAILYRAEGGPPVDFLFIDGDHSYEAVLADWRGWRPLMARGGVVALHDSHPSSERPLEDAGSRKVTEEVVLRDREFELVEIVDSLTVVRRAGDPAALP